MADDDLPAGLVCIRAAGDAIFAKTGAVKGLIIDVRSNGGGEDAFVLELASRLADRRYLAFGKQARITSAKKVRFTSRDSIFVEPGRGPRYLGEAVLLTGRHSASAAETFTMALRRPGADARARAGFENVLSRYIATPSAAPALQARHKRGAAPL